LQSQTVAMNCHANGHCCTSVELYSVILSYAYVIIWQCLCKLFKYCHCCNQCLKWSARGAGLSWRWTIEWPESTRGVGSGRGCPPPQ